MRKYDITADIKSKPNFYYPINGRKVKDLRVSKNWDEMALAKALMEKNNEDRLDIKNTLEYQAILFIEEDLEDGQACGSMISSLCKVFDCMPSDLCNIKNDFAPKVIFEDPEIIYFVYGERIISKLKLLERQRAELTKEQRAYLYRAENQTGLDEPYLRLCGREISRICEWVGCDPRYFCYLSENQIEEYIEYNENKFHYVDGNRIKKVRLEQKLTIEAVVQNIKKHGKFSRATETYFLQIEKEGLAADMQGDLLLVLCKVLKCKSIELCRSQTQSRMLENPENFFLIRGDRLRRIRQTNGYSIREIEKWTGVSKSTINRIEKSDKIYTKIRNIENIADVLNCSIEFLMGRANWRYGHGVITEYGKEQRLGFFSNKLKNLLDSDIKEIGPVNYNLLLKFIEILKNVGTEQSKREKIKSKLCELERSVSTTSIPRPNKRLFYSIIRKLNEEDYINKWYNEIFKMIYKYAESVRKAKTYEEVQKSSEDMAAELQIYEKNRQEELISLINQEFKAEWNKINSGM